MASSSSNLNVGHVRVCVNKNYKAGEIADHGGAPFRRDSDGLIPHGFMYKSNYKGKALIGETKNVEEKFSSGASVVLTKYELSTFLDSERITSGPQDTPTAALKALARVLVSKESPFVNLSLESSKEKANVVFGVKTKAMQEVLKLIHPSQFSTDEVAAASSAFQAAEAAKEPEHARKRASFAPAAKQVAAAPAISVEALMNAVVAKDSAGAVPLNSSNDDDLSATPAIAAFELSLSGLPLPSDGVYSTPIAEEHFAADPGQAASQFPLSGDEFIEDRGDIFANVEPIAVNDVEFGGA